MSGAGNTFIVGLRKEAEAIGLAPNSAVEVVPTLIRTLPRPDNKNVEGILVIDPKSHSFICDYYNPDGSYGMMCGNGARCAVRFALDNGSVLEHNQIVFVLNGVEYTAFTASETMDQITVRLPSPLQEQEYAPGSLRDVDFSVYYVFVQSDHAVIDMPLSDTHRSVMAIRHHPVFPRGCNVNMVEVTESGKVNIATFERGVEAITGACGTGAVASAIALWRTHRTPDQIMLMPPSQRPLTVTINHDGDTITSIDLTGDAKYDSE